MRRCSATLSAPISAAVRTAGWRGGNIFNALQYHGDRRSLIENATGGSGDDSLLGNAVDNRLAGGSGEDRLRGFSGRDTLIGGPGADTFVFRRLADSPLGGEDVIVRDDDARAFEGVGRDGGDLIDLSGIDANTRRPGDQHFAFDGGTGRGHLWVEERGNVSYVCGNIDRDAAVEFHLAIRDFAVRASDYAADDFVL